MQNFNSLVGGAISELVGGAVSELVGGDVSELDSGAISELGGGAISEQVGGAISELVGGATTELEGVVIREQCFRGAKTELVPQHTAVPIIETWNSTILSNKPKKVIKQHISCMV